MKRSGFLKRAGLLVGGLAVAKRLPEMPAYGAEAAAETLPVSTVALGSGEALVGSGGLCSPVSSYIRWTLLEESPVRDALPAFTASRGGIAFDRDRSPSLAGATPAWDDDDYWDIEGIWD